MAVQALVPASSAVELIGGMIGYGQVIHVKTSGLDPFINGEMDRVGSVW